ncbi:MAG: hypothetical protein AAFY08_15790 [Planctomycetota bacterium]
MPLYEMTSDALNPIESTTFADHGVLERQDLQRLFKNDLSALGLDVLLIEEELGNWDASQRRIDLLAIDRDANLVVIELKRGSRGAHMELQALRYAAMVGTMVFDEVVSRLAVTDESTIEEAQEKLLEFLEWNSPESGEFNADVRIVLVSADFSRELVYTVLWLNQRQLDISCVRLQPHRLDDRIILNVEPMVPLPEAGDYLIRQKEKAQADRATQQAVKTATGYTFFNVGEDKAGHRRWEDCRKYGFLQAGGGPRFRDKLAALNRGDRVLAYLKSHGYVGLGTVTGQATPLRDFVVASEGKRLLDLPIASTIHDGRLDDDERGEFCVGIEWTQAVPRETAVCGHLSKRGTSCRMLHQAEVDAIITAMEQVASS